MKNVQWISLMWVLTSKWHIAVAVVGCFVCPSSHAQSEWCRSERHRGNKSKLSLLCQNLFLSILNTGHPSYADNDALCFVLRLHFQNYFFKMNSYYNVWIWKEQSRGQFLCIFSVSSLRQQKSCFAEWVKSCVPDKLCTLLGGNEEMEINKTSSTIVKAIYMNMR